MFEFLLIGWLCAEMNCTPPKLIAYFDTMPECTAMLAHIEKRPNFHGYCISAKHNTVEN
jgi:hypothetical protein